jgi:hypothetical protein
MSFSRWLRSNAEYYLVCAAQARVARQKGFDFSAVRPRGLKDFFWYHVFVPVYHILPKTLRQFALHSLPGSHRHAWPKPGPRPRPTAQSILKPNP